MALEARGIRQPSTSTGCQRGPGGSESRSPDGASTIGGAIPFPTDHRDSDRSG